MELNLRLHINRKPTRFRKEPKKKYDVKSLVGNCKALFTYYEWMCNMDDNILQQLAKQFADAEHYQHDLYIGHGNTEIRIALNLSDEMFTHSFGLEHIHSIQAEVKNKNQNRIDLFHDLLQHGRSISGFSAVEQHSIIAPVPASYNPLTQKACTIEERLTALLSFSDIMSRLHDGKIYEFRPSPIRFESKSKNEKGKPLAKFNRDISIKADFVVKIRMPDQNGPDEYNMFLCFAKNNERISKFGKKRLRTCSVTLISAFADGVDITAGQTKCAVLKHTVLDKSTGEKTVPFQLKNYRPVDQPTVDTSLQNTNIMYYQPQQLPRSDVLTASDILSPSPKGFLDRLRELAAGIAAKVRELFSSSKQLARPAAVKQRPEDHLHSVKQSAPGHSDQALAQCAPQQAVNRKTFTLSGARRTEIAAAAKRAGHKDKPQQRREQALRRDANDLS